MIDYDRFFHLFRAFAVFVSVSTVENLHGTAVVAPGARQEECQCQDLARPIADDGVLQRTFCCLVSLIVDRL